MPHLLTKPAKGSSIYRLCMGLFFLVSIFMFSPIAMADDSQIQTILCDTSGPDVQVVSPVSDSTVSTSEVNMTGVAQRTSQLDIFINNVYSQSLALGADPNFSTTIALSEGTNTIRLEAFYSCNNTNASVSVVVSYVPKVPPSRGEDTNTVIRRPNIPLPGTVTNPTKTPPGKDGPIDRIEDKLKISTDSFVRPIFNWFILIIGFLAAFVALMPPYYLGLIFSFLPGWKNRKLSGRQQVIIRFIAAVIAVSFATMIQA